MITQRLKQKGCNTSNALLNGFTDEWPSSEEVQTRLVNQMCQEVNSSFSKLVQYHLNDRDKSKLIGLEVDPSLYSDATSYLKDACIAAAVRKFPSWSSQYDPKTEAMKTFIACEKVCQQTNEKIFSGQYNCPETYAILAMTSRKIAKVLGTCPEIEDLTFEFGPGASYSCKNNTSALDKLTSKMDSTPNCHQDSKRFLESCPGWRRNDQHLLVGPPQQRKISISPGDRLCFVPKNAKTDRPIAVGPLFNGLLQKGIGRVIRSRLNSQGLLLRHAQETHRRYAQESSVHGQLATIDLKSASDTISYGIVMDLLPFGWFDLLDRTRSKRYTIDGEWYTYHKFSAMGNGYTFELETLMFHSIAYCVCKYLGISTSEVSVYGDDIIIPQQAVDLLQKILSDVGFSVNSEKSYWEGPFRESCGGDFFRGTDVRPFFCKNGISTSSLFIWHNSWVRSGHRHLFPRTFLLIRKILGKQICDLFRAPLIDGDDFLVDETLPWFTPYNVVHRRRKESRQTNRMAQYGISYRLYERQDVRLEQEFNRVRDPTIATSSRKRYRYTVRCYRIL